YSKAEFSEPSNQIVKDLFRRVGHRQVSSAAGRRDDIVGHRDVNRLGKDSEIRIQMAIFSAQR
ncbi:MAG: hypothetical protein WCJ09_27560, partial [Planctomycetota bacterium]